MLSNALYNHTLYRIANSIHILLVSPALPRIPKLLISSAMTVNMAFLQMLNASYVLFRAATFYSWQTMLLLIHSVHCCSCRIFKRIDESSSANNQVEALGIESQTIRACILLCIAAGVYIQLGKGKSGGDSLD